ncbi:menaquinone biosynthesis family protein [Sphingobacterium composti Ten et al. 2007 non Yoo et al. 2007]|uniref:menaquinone biosynthesis family protein n=1 Tax=Sphingobacterium composti TaxID=363260 RepID=UPI00135797BC|nr:1,4-dihydroxy-6-naphthoate synthase [Sphingobacterium composti Ten et al. 2007 non Yoo et al. 2007]
MKLSLGFSPCPNDTFIFDALIHHKIDTEGLEFEVEYHDVETLNQKAFNKELTITKLSYHAFAYAVEDYELLDAGSALGFGVGPLLITKNQELAQKFSAYAGDDMPEEFKTLKIGIPGKYTTANFLLGLAYPELQNKEILVFSDIESALLNGKIDLGLIIHENRFTYHDKGLFKVVDLGDFWEKTTESPIPLGGIVIKRDLPQEIKEKVNRLIRQSVEYAFENPKSGIDYIRSYAQEMEEAVMYKHIELYVNQYSVDLGEIGKKAITSMFNRAYQLNIVPKTEKNVFLKGND